MKIDAMIFDMDGVVYDSEKMYFAADQKAAQNWDLNSHLITINSLLWRL